MRATIHHKLTKSPIMPFASAPPSYDILEMPINIVRNSVSYSRIDKNNTTSIASYRAQVLLVQTIEFFIKELQVVLTDVIPDYSQQEAIGLINNYPANQIEFIRNLDVDGLETDNKELIAKLAELRDVSLNIYDYLDNIAKSCPVDENSLEYNSFWDKKIESLITTDFSNARKEDFGLENILKQIDES